MQSHCVKRAPSIEKAKRHAAIVKIMALRSKLNDLSTLAVVVALACLLYMLSVLLIIIVSQKLGVKKAKP